MDLDNIRLIEPMGKLHGSHVTPTDHTYIRHTKLPEFREHQNAVRAGQPPQPWSSPYDVKSPADGYITDIQAFPFAPPDYGYTGILEDYRVIIWHSCAVSTIFIHLGGLAPEILEFTGEIPSGGGWTPRGRNARSLRVTAGQVIGKVGAQGIDFSVHDNRVRLEGLAVPTHYKDEAWKIHTVDPFAYFDNNLKSSLQAKNLRSADPKGGRIDYDVQGRLVGTWFLEGTQDYSGGGDHSFCGNRPCPYWKGHLAIAYDYIDPTLIRVSIGAEVGIDKSLCRICDGVYGVQGNGPDPVEVELDSGLVKYNLVGFEHTGEFRVVTKNVENPVLGVFLAQVIDDSTIKMEVFPGRTAAEIEGFSNEAKIYYR